MINERRFRCCAPLLNPLCYCCCSCNRLRRQWRIYEILATYSVRGMCRAELGECLHCHKMFCGKRKTTNDSHEPKAACIAGGSGESSLSMTHLNLCESTSSLRLSGQFFQQNALNTVAFPSNRRLISSSPRI